MCSILQILLYCSEVFRLSSYRLYFLFESEKAGKHFRITKFIDSFLSIRRSYVLYLFDVATFAEVLQCEDDKIMIDNII